MYWVVRLYRATLDTASVSDTLPFHEKYYCHPDLHCRFPYTALAVRYFYFTQIPLTHYLVLKRITPFLFPFLFS